MKTDQLIKQILTEYFVDFKNYHLIVLLIFTVIIALIQIIQTILVSRKIEKFKNDLKKSEIKFSKYNEMQIKALSEFYYILSDFNEQTILATSNMISPELNQKRTKKWLETYYTFHKNYSRNKYILPKNIKSILSTIFLPFEKMKSIIKIESKQSQLFYTNEYGDIEFTGNEEEMNTLNEEWNKLKRTEIIKTSIENIEKLKIVIEDYFEKIN